HFVAHLRVPGSLVIEQAYPGGRRVIRKVAAYAAQGVTYGRGVTRDQGYYAEDGDVLVPGKAEAEVGQIERARGAVQQASHGFEWQCGVRLVQYLRLQAD